MTSHNNVLEELKKHFSDKYNFDPQKINQETPLLYDLEILGDDVDEFFGDLIMHFKVDVKKIDLSRFFVGDEPFDFLSPVLRFLRRQDASKKPTIMIGDIEQFIRTGILY